MPDPQPPRHVCNTPAARAAGDDPATAKRDYDDARPDVEGGQNQQITEELRERLARMLYAQKCDWEGISPAHWSRVIPTAKETYFRFADEILGLIQPRGEGDGGQVEEADLREAVRSLLALRRGTGPKEAGARYLPDNEATRTALDILAAAFHAPAQAAIRSVLSQPQAGEEEVVVSLSREEAMLQGGRLRGATDMLKGVGDFNRDGLIALLAETAELLEPAPKTEGK